MPHAEPLGVEVDGCGDVSAGQDNVVDGLDCEGCHGQLNSSTECIYLAVCERKTNGVCTEVVLKLIPKLHVPRRMMQAQVGLSK
jgi:hypothetical protein